VALFPGAGTRKVKPIWILLKQETVSGSGISWAVCKSATRSRQITMPAPTTPFFTGRMPFLPPNQQRQSTEVINESFFGLIIHIQKSRQTNTDMYENNGLFSRCYKITGMMNKPCHYQCSFM